MVRVGDEGHRRYLFEFQLDFQRSLAPSQTRPVSDAENVRIDRDSRLAERDIEDDVGGLAADSGQDLELVPCARNFAAEVVDQNARGGDDVLCLCVEQADGLDVLLQLFLAKIQHLLRRLDFSEQCAGRFVHPDIGRLRRQGYGDEQRVGVNIFQLGLRRRIGIRQPPVEFENVGFVQRESMTSRMV